MRELCEPVGSRRLAVATYEQGEDYFMKRITTIVSIVCLITLSLPVSLMAQITGGSIQGVVRNHLHEPVAGAKVTAVHTGTNQSRSTVTDEEGNYRLPALAIGPYEVTIEAATYQNMVQRFTLRVNEDARVDGELQVAGSNEQVTVVSSSAPITETSSSVLGIVVENKQINELPLNGRHFLHLGTLVANVNSTPSLKSGAEGGARNGPFAVGGARDRSLTFLVDGVDSTESLSGSLSARISIDAIQEFKMVTNLGSAEYGYHSGGTINILTKSGANDFHFSMFEFLRDKTFNSENHFETLAGKPASPFRNNQFGGTVNGHLMKDRTFFMSNYEGQRLRAGTPQFSNVPTEAERQGIFRNPFTGQSVQLPVDPVSKAILNRYLPLPNAQSEFGNYISTPELTSRTDFGILKIDHLLSGDDVINGRYYVSDGNTFNPVNPEAVGLLGKSPTISGFGLTERTRTQNLAIAYTHNFSVQTINDLRFGYNRYYLDQLPEDQQPTSELGFSGVEGVNGLYLFNVTGITAFGAAPYPIYNRVRNFHISDSLATTFGRHALKVGGEVRMIKQSQQYWTRGQASLFFAGFASGISPLADFVMGVPTFVLALNRSITSPMQQSVSGFFVQDDYQVNRRLVLNLGLRYELATVLNSPEHKLTNYSFARGLFTPGVDTDTGLYKGDHNNFAPRVGFAWSVTEDGRTVVRGGYGIYYDNIVHSIAARLNTQNEADGPLFSASLAQPGPGRLGGMLNPATLLPLGGPSQAYDENLRTPYAQHFNLTLQRELTRTMVLSLGYVGTKGTKVTEVRNINQAVYLPGTDANGLPLSTPFNIESRRPSQLYQMTPYPVGAIEQFGAGASSIYHAFQATFNKRMGRGLSVLGAYTWSKSIDNATDPFGFTGDSGAPSNSYDLRQERGRSVFDIPHQFTMGFNYELPFIGSQWVQGWQINGIATLKSGQPFTPLLGLDTSLTGTFANRPNYVPEAFIVKDGQVSLNRSLPLDPATGLPAAIVPQNGQFGNLGRNTFNGPGYKNFDLSVLKEIRAGERVRIQARLEMFNLFNTTNLALPERRVLDPFFGRSTRTPDVAGGVPGIGGGGPRAFQVAFRLVY
jgi:hypothetical protein